MTACRTTWISIAAASPRVSRPSRNVASASSRRSCASPPASIPKASCWASGMTNSLPGSLAPRSEEQSIMPEDPFIILDERFNRYTLPITFLEKLHGGFRWAEGPVYFADHRCLLFSDIPNNRMMRYDEESGSLTVFGKPANNTNGNTRDRQGRLISCEHGTRQVTRTEFDGS